MLLLQGLADASTAFGCCTWTMLAIRAISYVWCVHWTERPVRSVSLVPSFGLCLIAEFSPLQFVMLFGRWSTLNVCHGNTNDSFTVDWSTFDGPTGHCCTYHVDPNNRDTHNRNTHYN